MENEKVNRFKGREYHQRKKTSLQSLNKWVNEQLRRNHRRNLEFRLDLRESKTGKEGTSD